VAIAPYTPQRSLGLGRDEMTSGEYRNLLEAASTPAGRKELRKRAMFAVESEPDSNLRTVLPGLVLINCGSERTAFMLKVVDKPAFVFKIATAKRAGGQTRSEIHCWQKTHNPLAPLFYSWASNFTWVEMQVLDPVDADDFEDLTGIAFETFDGAMWGLDEHLERVYGEGDLDEYKLNDRRIIRERRKLAAGLTWYLELDKARGAKAEKARAFIVHVVNLVIDCRILPTELTSEENWGVTKRGKIKVLDLGGVPDVG